MRREILRTAAMGALFLAGVSARMGAQAQDQHGQQSQQATKTITGKALDIGDNGHSFPSESNDGSGKQPMKFVVDQNTKVEGHVKIGSMVLVDYQPTDGGQLRCVRVAPTAELAQPVVREQDKKRGDRWADAGAPIHFPFHDCN